MQKTPSLLRPKVISVKGELGS